MTRPDSRADRAALPAVLAVLLVLRLAASFAPAEYAWGLDFARHTAPAVAWPLLAALVAAVAFALAGRWPRGLTVPACFWDAGGFYRPLSSGNWGTETTVGTAVGVGVALGAAAALAARRRQKDMEKKA